MGLVPRLLIALGVLTAVSSGQSPVHFTKDGKPCVAVNATGIPAKCGKYDGKTQPLCYWTQTDWKYCNADYANEFRCNNQHFTRHGNCKATSDDYCCGNYGFCGNAPEFCNCTNCRDLRDEECKRYDCGATIDGAATGVCYWDTDRNKTSCECHDKYHKDNATDQCMECLMLEHCDVQLTCIMGRCVDPCDNYCDISTLATCEVTNHQPLCLCPDGYKLVENKAGQPNKACEIDHSQFVVISSVSSCFFLSAARLNWYRADSFCKRHNTTLAQPKDLKLLQELQAVTNMSANNFWLGGQGNGGIMAWTKGGEEVYGPNSSQIWKQGHPGLMVNSSFCTLYNSQGVHGMMLSSELCGYPDGYNFICQIDRCDVPNIVGSPILKNFSETSITVSLPNIEDADHIQSLYVVMVVGRKNISGIAVKPNSSFAEDIARLKYMFTSTEKPWIAAEWPSQNSSTDQIIIGDDHPLVQNKEYFVALVVATSQGDFTLYNSSDFGGPFFATEYRKLRIRDLLSTACATSVTLWLAIGLYTIIQRYCVNP